jgi:alpha-L-fucosidase
MSRRANWVVVAIAILQTQTSIMASIPSTVSPSIIVNTQSEPMASGKFKPEWQSLSQYEVPEWFRDAKFGIWAHWGPQ